MIEDSVENPAAHIKVLRNTLDKTFGLTELREGQEGVISSVLAGNNTLAVMPTGAGKSLCYQMTGLLLPGLTVVISPLISLMKDQVDKLVELGVEATQLHSSVREQAQLEAIANIEARQGEFVFATPERLTDPEFLDTLRRSHVSLVVVDEAHCISQWGHDFRPAFLEISRAIEMLGRPRVLALTATATERVAEDICKQLSPRGMKVVRTGLYRANLEYSVVAVTNEGDREQAVLKVLADTPGPGIIYTATVKAADALYERLLAEGHSAVIYHGKLSGGDRERNQNAFMSGNASVMVATNAFGMGIDKADIRFVLHYQMPGSLEAYYQESGRAGRDGQRSRCVLLYHVDDKRIHRFFMGGRYPDREHMAKLYDHLATLEEEGTPATLKHMEAITRGSMAKSKVQVGLRLLRDKGVVGESVRGRYKILQKNLSADELEHMLTGYRERAANDKKMLDQMVFYAQTAMCRWKPILAYFGEEVSWHNCGSCDNCRRPPKVQAAPPRVPLRKPRARRAPLAPWKTGDMANVAKYGMGEVIGVADQVLSLRFPDGEVRDFLSRFVKKAPRVS